MACGFALMGPHEVLFSQGLPTRTQPAWEKYGPAWPFPTICPYRPI